MSDSVNFPETNYSLSASLTGEIAVASVVAIFLLFIVALILYLRAKRYSGTMGILRSSHHNLVFAQYQPKDTKKPLDSNILKSIPVITFCSEDFKDEEGVDECAVCITDIKDGEKVRLLPKCKHGFHVECIDMWFMSNSTCPLCRNIVMADSSIDAEPSGSGMSTVNIPKQTTEPEAINSPILDKLRSDLRRIMSSGSLNPTFNDSCSWRSHDIEQGGMKKSSSVSELIC